MKLTLFRGNTGLPKDRIRTIIGHVFALLDTAVRGVGFDLENNTLQITVFRSSDSSSNNK